MTYLLTAENTGGILDKALFLTEADTGKEAAMHLLEAYQPGMSMNYALVENPEGNKITAVPHSKYVSDHRTLASYVQSDDTLIIHLRPAHECEETLLDHKLEPIES